MFAIRYKSYGEWSYLPLWFSREYLAEMCLDELIEAIAGVKAARNKWVRYRDDYEMDLRINATMDAFKQRFNIEWREIYEAEAFNVESLVVHTVWQAVRWAKE